MWVSEKFSFLVTVNDWVNWIATTYGAPVIAFGALCWLVLHLVEKRARLHILFSVVMIFATAGIFIILAIQPQPMSLGRMSSLLLMYGVGIFVLLSTVMLGGLAERITKWRGEKWVKELDYIYLTLGSAGIIASMNRLPFVTGKIDTGDLFAPLLLITAVVIRFIKTRAEIGGWNKLPN
jgi:hypothetical protein